MKERLLAFIEKKRISKSEFERRSGLSNGYVKNIGDSIGSKILENILKAYPDLNRDWLLTGEGEMLKTTQSVGDISNSNVSGVNVNGKEIHISSMEAYSTLLKIVESNLKTTEKFQEQIDRLIGVIEHKYEAEQK